MTHVPDHIFKSYDIRGLVEGELSEAIAYQIGYGFVKFLESKEIQLTGKKIVVGKDMRPTSPLFAEAVKRAIMDQGVDVVDMGDATTPLFNFTCAYYDDHAAGIFVTASHNPAEYNGFKPTFGDGLAIGAATGLMDIREFAKETPVISDVQGTETTIEPLQDYLDRLFSIVSKEDLKPLKIVIDAGNGMGKVTFPALLEQLPVDVEYLYLEPDGTFPNHEANPLKIKTLADLSRAVVAYGADFGFALDGDGDRMGLVDGTGQPVDPSITGALIGLEVLRDHSGIHMLYDLRSSHIVAEVWEAAGATTDKCMVGHANIKQYMRDNGASFASELSLHLFFGDMYNVESTDLCLLYVLRALSREGKSLAELIAPMQGKYFHSGEINFEVEKKDAAIAAIKDAFAPEAQESSDLDGLWLGFDWGWLSVRKSNTEPVLRLNLETFESDDVTKSKIALVTQILRSFVV
jgi:phosphomannomutase